jgi:hypothetical protein
MTNYLPPLSRLLSTTPRSLCSALHMPIRAVPSSKRVTWQRQLVHRGELSFVICPTQSDTLRARLVFNSSSGISHHFSLSSSSSSAPAESTRAARVNPLQWCGCLVNAWSSRLVYCFEKRKAAKLSGVNAALPIQEEGQTVLLAVQSIDINGG